MKKLICLALLLMVAAVALSVGTDELKCATCGRVIKKTRHYLEYEGKTFCSQPCFEAALPKCATCGTTVGDGKKQGDFLKYKGKIYCSQACFEEALPKCATCGKPVNGGFLVDNKHYCNQECHTSSLPRCAVCGKPVDGGLRDLIDRTKIYCSRECFNTTLPSCDLCGARMQAWRTIDDRKYCEACATLPRCSDCQHPGADVRLSDGRLLCKKCDSTAMFDTAAARVLYEDTRREIAAKLSLSTDRPIIFHLVDQNQLARAAKVKRSSERGLYCVKGDQFDIFVLNGLQPAEFRDVAAHELAHDIQQQLYPRLKGKILKEGFAEYVAGLMATAWGNEKLNQDRIQNEFKEYAAGYQKMVKIGENGGLAAVLDYLKKQNRTR